MPFGSEYIFPACQVPGALGPEGRAVRLTRAAPNKALEPTAPMVAFTHAAVSTWRGGSPRALGASGAGKGGDYLETPSLKDDQGE